MIYGVKVILNDCNFRLKTQERRMQERYSFQAFFTNRQSAMQCYSFQLKRFMDEQKLSFRSLQLRGSIDLFIAKIEAGMIYEHGKTLLSETVK